MQDYFVTNSETVKSLIKIKTQKIICGEFFLEIIMLSTKIKLNFSILFK